MLRRTFGTSLIAAAVTAHAQIGDSASPLKLVIPFPPGDAFENAARILGDLVAKDMKVPVIIENRPGAAGVIAAEAVSKTTDGRTFLIGTAAITGITPYLRTVQYSPSDFDPVAKFAHILPVMAIRNDLPAKNWKEFVALAKASPGRYTYATPGDGSLTHLTLAAIARNAGIQMQAIPYKGMGPALQDFIGGRLDLYAEPAVIPHVKSGAVRALGVASKTRLPELPDVPTYDEAGIKATTTSWIGILAPKATPVELKRRLASAMQRAVSSPEFSSRLPPGLQAAYSSSSDFATQIESEQKFYKQLIASLDLKIQ